MKHKQNGTIYLVHNIGNADDTVEFQDEVCPTFDDEVEALKEAKENTTEYGMRTYVYKCIPILRVDRGKLRVTKLKSNYDCRRASQPKEEIQSDQQNDIDWGENGGIPYDRLSMERGQGGR